ncbi:MAG: glycosyl hydrolase [Chloroflexi bacterium]|nr:glycosyl hydrolase [Chloroflexota bacterium]
MMLRVIVSLFLLVGALTSFQDSRVATPPTLSVPPPSQDYVDAPTPAITSPFGLNSDIAVRYAIIHGEQSLPTDLLAKTGAKWTREEFRWDWIQPQPDKWEWAYTDEMVALQTAEGISILGLLDYAVAWSAGKESDRPHYGMPDVQKWYNYVYEVAKRYQSKVLYWELWNEENTSLFWKPEPNAEQYTQILKAGYAAVKAANPKAKVLIGGTAGVDTKFFDQVAANGGWNYFDVLAVHPYLPRPSFDQGDLPGELVKAKNAVDKYGEKPIWITEVGWNSSTSGAGLGTEEQQAIYMVRTYLQALSSPGVEKLFWYEFHDDGANPIRDEHNYGLVKLDWKTLKAPFYAYQTMTKFLEGSRFVSWPNFGSAIHAYRFQGPNGRSVDVMWADAGGEQVELTGSSDTLAVHDLYGQPVSAGGANRVLQLKVGPEPVYVDYGPPRPQN